MRRSTTQWSVRMLADFQHRMNVDAEYQRGKVWSKAQQALLIDSILRGFEIPGLIVRKVTNGGHRLFDVIDGKQRLTAMWSFISDDIRLLRTSSDLPGLGNLSGKCWSELPATAQDRLQFASITVSQIEEATQEEIHELFLRFQKGEPLNAAERRNAMIGPVRDFVATRLSEHPLWPTTAISSRRFGIHEHSAIVLALVHARGPTSLKGADLEHLYEDMTFDPGGDVAQETLALLNTLHEISRSKPRLLRTRWGLVDLSLVLLRDTERTFADSPQRVAAFFEDFERMRRDVGAALTDYQTRMVEVSLSNPDREEALEQLDVPQDVLSYHLAFAREGGTVENITIRLSVLFDRLRQYFATL